MACYGVSRLHNFLLLQIAEFCDAQTLHAMTQVPVLRPLLRSLASSTLKRNMRRHGARDDVIRGGYIVDSLRTEDGVPVMSRRILPVGTIGAVDCMERRAYLVDSILQSRFFDTRRDLGWRKMLDDDQRRLLGALMRRGIQLCDRLVDFEAVVGECSRGPLCDEAMEQESLELRYAFAVYEKGRPDLALARTGMDGLLHAQWRLRHLQGEFIRTRSTQELLCMALALHMARRATKCTRFAGMMSEDGQRVVARPIDEAILRHGSWLLACWSNTGLVSPAGSAKTFPLFWAACYDLVTPVWAPEEAGEGEDDGAPWARLTTVMYRELRRRLGMAEAEADDEQVMAEALLQVDDVVRGKPQAVPRAPLFV